MVIKKLILMSKGDKKMKKVLFGLLFLFVESSFSIEATDSTKCVIMMKNINGDSICLDNNEPEVIGDASLTIVRGGNKDTGEFSVEHVIPGQISVIRKAKIEKDDNDKWRIKVFKGSYVEDNLGKIIAGSQLSQSSEFGEDTGVVGLEVGRVIYTNFNDWPIDIVAVIGLATHNDKSYQGRYSSYTAMVKLEWKKFPWSNKIRTKFELGEGINYAEKVPYFEGLETRRENDGRDSKLLNYLGVGIAFNLGDLLSIKSLEKCYIGGYIYHRSGVLGRMKIYNNVSGGSNFPSISMECSM